MNNPPLLPPPRFTDHHLDEYIALPIEDFRTEAVIDCQLYLKIGPENYVKYRESGIRFDEDVRFRLLENRHTHLYIRSADSNKLNRYLEKNLKSTLKNASLPTIKKAEVLYTTTTHLVKDILVDPSSSEGIQGAKTTVESTVGFIISEPESLRRMMEISSFDYYTYTHSVNVMTYAIALGHNLDYSTDSRLNNLGLSALLHDVGKTYINPRITNKRGPLSEAEFEEMKLHPEYGYQALQESGEVNNHVLESVRFHHERPDGSGYPLGISGSQIDLDLRIIACADIYDALTTRRVYRKAYGSYSALNMMKDSSGKEIDENVYRSFVSMLGDV